LLSRLFQDRSEFKPAYYYLNRAEKKAKEFQNFELLDIIYSDFIRLSHETLSINPEVYIEARKENREQLNRLREIDDILAVLIYRIKRSQNYTTRNDRILEVLQKTIEDYADTEELHKNPQVRFKIYHSISRILLQQRNYGYLEEYLRQTWKEFSREKLFTKGNHDTKLQMLVYLVNALFKNNKFEASLQYTELLHEAMQEHGGFLFDKYLFNYYNGLIINYSRLNKSKAIELSREAIESEKIDKFNPQVKVIFHLNLSILYFEQQDFKQSNRSLVRLKLHEQFEQLDNVFRLKILILELIIRYEQGDFDFIEYQADQVRKEYRDELKDPNLNRQSEMLEVLLEMIITSSIRKNEALTKRIHRIINGMEDEKASDSDILSYNDWLRSKL